jgi:hypothetical protein
MSGVLNPRQSVKDVSLNSSSRFAYFEPNTPSAPNEVSSSELSESNKNAITEQSVRDEF